ncbi:MAG: hypothetical protein A3J48_00265 [Candidatus Doudnabacteria bacterium RIFCSPHIGHO2_02_FULL_46_11]|uniref:Uncharacterized protein n=1 Tax=Candidatus Doudnabacteria bacterium RIFCSPHIGHO2_02_FULL_46_11 TaxID=1817832 RepID=A0A1F5P6L0_9BACT|nr:MAG: hypothetical protein A3J48_00265 [Candidatus Doudnabacteria bacterium RIFCSPHIGHO2_02_FULL_46_11]
MDIIFHQLNLLNYTIKSINSKLQHSNSNKTSSPKPPARLRLDDLPDKTSSFRSQAGVQAGWQFPELIIEVCLPADLSSEVLPTRHSFSGGGGEGGSLGAGRKIL